MDRDFANWFCGFVDGEGCFSVHRANNTHYEKYVAAFVIRLRADDYAILETCQRAFDGIGKLAIHKPGVIGGPVAQWKVTSAKDMNRIVAFFDEYKLRAKKALDFELWKQAVSEYSKPHRHRNQRKLAELCRIMSQVKRLEGEGQYAYDDPQLSLFDR